MTTEKRKQRELPGNPASAIYGTIVTAGLLVPRDGDHAVLATVGSILGTLAVFWLAHAYTDVLGGVIVNGERRDAGGLVHALRVEWPIIESGVLPIAAFLIAHWVGASFKAATLSGLITAVVELIAWAWLATRRSGVPVRARIPYLLGSAALGVAIIALKAAIH